MEKIIEKSNDGLVLRGEYHLRCYDKNGKLKWHDKSFNKIVNQGINYIMNNAMGTGTQVPLYLFITETSYNATGSDTMATLLAAATECVAYNESSRPLYNKEYSGGSVNNYSNKASFLFNANRTIRGVGLTTNPTKGDNGGILISHSTIAGGKTFDNGDTFTLAYVINASSLT